MVMVLGLLAFASETWAQLAPMGGPLPAALGPLARLADQIPDRATQRLDPADMVSLRLDRLRAVIRAHPKLLDRDDDANPVVRGQVLAVAPSARSLTIAVEAGFSLLKPADPDAGDAGVAALGAPPRLPVRQAVKELRRLH